SRHRDGTLCEYAGACHRCDRVLCPWLAHSRRRPGRWRREVGMERESLAQFYARKVGQTQREIQRLERERRRLLGLSDHAYIDLELSYGGGEEAELARRSANVEAAADEHRDELLRLTVEILKLQDRLIYYRQLEALHADGTVPGPN